MAPRSLRWAWMVLIVGCFTGGEDGSARPNGSGASDPLDGAAGTGIVARPGGASAADSSAPGGAAAADTTSSESAGPSICSLAPDAGPCKAAIERWYYDLAAGGCARFSYGGCDGNENNFATSAECLSRCGGASDLPLLPCASPDARACHVPGRLQHPSCAEALPDPLPPLPAIRLQPDGTPRFAQWEAIECASVTDFACPGAGAAECGLCLRDVGADMGVCSYADADIWCDGDGEAIGYRDGQCWICGPPEAHAAACCANIAGFDCRRWPYAADGVPGTVCARHEDCEPGLLCGGHRGSGYGICQCPGIGGDLAPADSCFR